MAADARRAIVVVRAALRTAANQAAAEVDPDGGPAFTSPLRTIGDTTNTVRAYWAGWTLTRAELSALRGWLRAKGATDAEIAVVPASARGAFTPAAGARAYFFDARAGGWSPAEVRSALGLEPLNIPLPGAP